MKAMQSWIKTWMILHTFSRFQICEILLSFNSGETLNSRPFKTKYYSLNQAFNFPAHHFCHNVSKSSKK